MSVFDLTGSIGKTNMPQLEYKGWQQTRTTDAIRTTITVAQKQEVLTALVFGTYPWSQGQSQFLNPDCYRVGAWFGNDYVFGPNLGTLEEAKIMPADGPFWNLQLSYNKSLSTYIENPTSSTTSGEPTENSLTVKMLSMPIETHSGYVYRWNHALMGCCIQSTESAAIIQAASGANLNQAEALINSDQYRGRLKWIKSPDQIPTEKETVTMPNETTSAGYWKVMVGMTKPGVEVYQMPTYEIVEKAKHSNRNNAAWAVAAYGGFLRYPGGTGDFGLQNKFFPTAATNNIYHWRCLGAQLDFDGKMWVATCTYEWSPDPRGWDQELYKVSPAGYGYNNKNSIFYIPPLTP